MELANNCQEVIELIRKVALGCYWLLELSIVLYVINNSGFKVFVVLRIVEERNEI